MSLKNSFIEFLRIWGYPLPSKMAILNDSDSGKKLILENFKINFGARRHYNKNDKSNEGKKQDEKAEKPNEKQDASANKEQPLANSNGKPKKANKNDKEKKSELEPDEEIKELIDDLDIDHGLSTITDLDTFDEYFIAGKAENMSRMRIPADLYWGCAISAVLPILLIIEIWNIFLIYNVPYDPVIAGVAATFFVMLSVHNYRYAYRTKIDALIATRRGTLGGVPVYIPNLKEFMTFKQTRNVELMHDGITALTAENKPLKMENEKLTRTLGNVYDGYDRAFVDGKREGLTVKSGGVKQHLGTFAIFAIFVAGILIGWLISNGFGFMSVPTSDNGTLSNGTLSKLLGG